MFDALGARLTGVLDRLSGRKTLDADALDGALRDVRMALLEADVALPAVRGFLSGVRERIAGQLLGLTGETAGQQAVRAVFEEMRRLLGADDPDSFRLDFRTPAPAVWMTVGLQGAGKTTSAGKLGHLLQRKHGKRVLLASLDLRRPAAREQLQTLAGRAGVDSLPIADDADVASLTRRALGEAARGGFDVLILDTAGRTVLDEDMMLEAEAVRAMAAPREVLLALDALSGQDALRVAEAFDRRLGVTGVILTRVDSDARGGAALSVRFVTGKPIKLIGVGEKIDDLETFDPGRAADRILGMGDVVALAEKAAENIDAGEAEGLMKRMLSGKFDLNDQLTQMRQIRKLGGAGGIMKLMPGMRDMREQMEKADPDGKLLRRQEAIILSMTPHERKHPEVIGGARRRRIAAGSGVNIADVNKLLKAYEETVKMMKELSKATQGKGMFGRMFQKAAAAGEGGLSAPGEGLSLSKFGFPAKKGDFKFPRR